MTLARQPVRVADGDGPARPPGGAVAARAFYPVARSARPAHAMVPLPLGAGHDPAALAKALKVLKKQLDAAGVSGLMRRDGRLYAARSPSQARRFKARMARRRAMKNARRAAWRDWYAEARGL